MSFNDCNAGSRLLRGEGDLFVRFLLTRGWSPWGGREKSSMDADRARLRGSTGLLGRGIVVVARKVAFSSHKAALTTRKEANYCWWDSC